jgi:hypothetical protein
MAPPDFHIEKEKVGVLTGPDQVDGVSPFGKDTMVLPLYVIIRLDTWVVSYPLSSRFIIADGDHDVR